MQNDLRLQIKKGDFLAIALVILLAMAVAWVFLPLRGESGGTLQVYLDGKPVHEMPLSVDAEYVISDAYENTIAVQNGRAAIIRSDCPGEDCVHSGWISAVGRSIVCLPNRVELRITGADSDVDFVVGVM